MNDDFPVLAIVATQPGHPYQVLEHLQALGVAIARSTLYRRVDALVAAGLLAAADVRATRGHAHRELSLTASGRARLASEVRQALRKEPLESPLFTLALQCGELVDDAAATLRVRMASAARALTREETALAGAADGWGRASRERRIAHLQTDLQWLQSVAGRAAETAPEVRQRIARFG